jgi:hypothetical protein
VYGQAGTRRAIRAAMPGLAQAIVREPASETAHQYRRRVSSLAWSYLGLFLFSLVGIVLLVWQAHLFVTLAQRSNVETLTLAFFLVFFAYLAAISTPGARGALTVIRFDLQRRWSRDPQSVERAIVAQLRPSRAEVPVAALNRVLDRDSAPGQPFTLDIRDQSGDLGTINIDGVEVSHRPAIAKCSNSLLAFFVHQVNMLLDRRGDEHRLDVVEWQTIDDESAQKYLCSVAFARNLERKLDAGELWPRITLTDDECQELEGILTEVCPAIRSEAFLPDWEFSGEHKLPIIPEPLGLISLGRSERRVDPLTSMGCAVLGVLGIVIVLGLFILFPPWVPGV